MASPRNRRPAGDVTGRKGQKLQEEAIKAQKEAQERLTMARAEKQIAVTRDVLDPSSGEVVATLGDDQEPEVDVDLGVTDEELVEALKSAKDPAVKKLLARFAQLKAREDQVYGSFVEAGDDYVIVRVNSDINRMTFGNDQREYNFERGRQYKVSRAMAEHLDRIDRLWR